MPVKRACEIMKVSTSGYYDWLRGKATRVQARADILSYLLYYDRTRIHSHLGYFSPYAFENLSILEHSYDPAA